MARRHRIGWLLLVLAFVVGCATPRPRPTPAPSTPGPGTQGPGTEPELVTFEVFAHDLRTPGVGLQGVTLTCGGQERLTNPDGTAHFDVPAGRQLDCQATREGYDPNTASAVPGLDARLTVWLHRAFAAPTHPDPWQGAFRIDRRAFVSDGGPKLPGCFHLGNIIGHGLVLGVDAVLPAFDQVAGWGYHCIRAWFQLHIPPGQRWLPGATVNGWDPRRDPARFVEILRAAAARGLKWNLAAGGIKGLGNADEDQLFDLLADAIGQVGPEHIAQVVALNEARDTGDDDDLQPAELERLINRVRNRHPQLLYALTAYSGVEDAAITARYTRSWMQHSVVHGSRDGRAHDKIRHIFSWMYERGAGRDLAWQDEPFGVGRLVSAQANHGELDAHVMQCAAATSAMSRQVWTFMSGPGVVYGDEPLEAMPGAAETMAILRALPQDLMRFETLGHSGDSRRGTRIHAVRGDRPNVREDYAIAADGRYLAIQYGPPNEPKDLPRERATVDDRVLLDGPWCRVTTGRLE